MSKKIIRVRKIKKSKQDANIKYGATNKGEYIDKKEEKKIKKLLYFKTKKDRFIALILRKNKSSMMVYIPTKSKSFAINGNTYFSVQSGAYLSSPKNTVISVYLEGCCLPIEHSHIKYEKHYVLLSDKNGLNVTEITGDIDKDDLLILPKDNEGNFLKNEHGFIVKKILDRIVGLEFDTTIANTIFDSGLIEKVGHGGKSEKFYFILFLVVIINIILTVGCIISTRV